MVKSVIASRSGSNRGCYGVDECMAVEYLWCGFSSDGIDMMRINALVDCEAGMECERGVDSRFL